MDGGSRISAVTDYRILDTPPDPELDRLSRLCALTFGVPIATIAIVDGDRQWFKSRHGLDLAEIPRDASFHATSPSASTDDMVVVPDVTVDARFAGSPLVEGTSPVRFYAAAPLLAPGGERIGTLAIMDRLQRQMEPNDITRLRQFADVVMDRMNLWKVARSPIDGPMRTEATRDASDAGTLLGYVTEQLPAILWTVDHELRFSSIIGAGLAAIGLVANQLVGRKLAEFLADDPRGDRHMAAHRAALQGKGNSTEVRFAGRFYQTRIDPLRDEDGVVRGTIGVALDITDRKTMELKLVQAERLASMGTLAAGVAHEINNPLTYVMANVGFVSERLAKLARSFASDPSVRPSLALVQQIEELRTALVEAQEGTVRVRRIVRDLKIFARGDEEAYGVIDLRHVIESSISMVWNEIRHRARLVKDLSDVPPIEASESRLGQVFLNLLLNAAQAIEAGDAAANEIRVATETDEAGRVVIMVSDTGVGIPPEILGRIFDPFFTTKPVGFGTGLGLFICHGIIKAMNGDISVESQPGKGTTFRVVLPAATRVETPKVEVSDAPVVEAGSRVRRRVLLIDDEPHIASGIERALASDHDVVTATSGQEAMRTLAIDDRFDVILCDLMMPNVTGMDLFAYLERERPALVSRMVFMTGGAFTPGAGAFLTRISNRCLEKPFDVARLRATIREV